MFKYSNVKVLAFHNILLVEDIISINESIFYKYSHPIVQNVYNMNVLKVAFTLCCV